MGCSSAKAAVPDAPKVQAAQDVSPAQAPTAGAANAHGITLLESAAPSLSEDAKLEVEGPSAESGKETIAEVADVMLVEPLAAEVPRVTPVEIASQPVEEVLPESERRPSRSSKKVRVSFHEAQPEAIVTSAKLEQRISEMEEKFSCGDRVECRDNSDKTWRVGVVTSVTPLEVCPDGKKTAFAWHHVRHYIEPSNDDEDENSDMDSPIPQPAVTALDVTAEVRKQRDANCC